MKEVAYEGEAFRREELAWEERKRTYKKLRQKSTPPLRVRTLDRDLKHVRKNISRPFAPKKKYAWTLNHALLLLAFVFAFSIGIGAYALFDYSDEERPRSHWNEQSYATPAPTTTPRAVAPPREETREAATLDVADPSLPQIAADTAIIAGNTYLLPGSTREIRTIHKDDNETTHLNAREFLSTVTPKVSPSFLRAISEQSYQFGLVMTEKRLEGYLVLSIISYDYAAGGMRTWETSLGGDMLPFIAPWRSRPAITMIGKRAFTDLHIGDVDTRVILDDAGEPVFIYAFLNKDQLIFTTSKEAFITLLSLPK
jgi:hypothetical protein